MVAQSGGKEFTKETSESSKREERAKQSVFQLTKREIYEIKKPGNNTRSILNSSSRLQKSGHSSGDCTIKTNSEQFVSKSWQSILLEKILFIAHIKALISKWMGEGHLWRHFTPKE